MVIKKFKNHFVKVYIKRVFIIANDTVSVYNLILIIINDAFILTFILHPVYKGKALRKGFF